MSRIELTTMVMVQDLKTGKTVLLDRIKNYKGLAFPGGHVEDGGHTIIFK